MELFLVPIRRPAATLIRSTSSADPDHEPVAVPIVRRSGGVAPVEETYTYSPSLVKLVIVVPLVNAVAHVGDPANGSEV